MIELAAQGGEEGVAGRCDAAAEDDRLGVKGVDDGGEGGGQVVDGAEPDGGRGGVAGLVGGDQRFG